MEEHRADGGQIVAPNSRTPEQPCQYGGTCSHKAGRVELWVSVSTNRFCVRELFRVGYSQVLHFPRRPLSGVSASTVSTGLQEASSLCPACFLQGMDGCLSFGCDCARQQSVPPARSLRQVSVELHNRNCFFSCVICENCARGYVSQSCPLPKFPSAQM